MAYTKSPFRSYIPKSVKGPAIVLLILLQSFVSGITASSVQQISSFYGLERSTVILFTQSGAIGMVAIIPIYYRLRMCFQKADLLYTALLAQFIISFLCYTLNNSTLLLVCNFFMGMLKLMCLLDFISLLVALYPSLRHRALFYGFYYALARTLSQFSNIVTNNTAEQYGWQVIYFISALAALICIILCILLFHEQRTHRRIPLYQVEWISMFLFIISAVSFCYVLTLGQTKEWFDAADIRYAAGIFLLSASVFVYRQYHIKRPYWNIRVFRLHKQIPLGIMFMIVMYFFSSTGLILDQYAKYNFNNIENYLSAVAAITLCAYVICFPLAGLLLYYGMPKRLLLCIGFMCYAISLICFCHIVQTSLSFYNLFLPYLLQGMAYAFTITTLSTFTATNIPRSHNPDRVMSSLSSRYIVGSFAGYSIYTNWLYRDMARQKVYLSERLTDNNFTFIDELRKVSSAFISIGMNKQEALQMAKASIEKRLQLQAMLVSMKEITFYAGGLAIIVAVVVLLIRKFGMHETASGNRYKIV